MGWGGRYWDGMGWASTGWDGTAGTAALTLPATIGSLLHPDVRKKKKNQQHRRKEDLPGLRNKHPEMLNFPTARVWYVGKKKKLRKNDNEGDGFRKI